MHSNWSGVLRNQIKKYNVLNFSNWRDGEAFNGKVERLLSGIKLFYSAKTSWHGLSGWRIEHRQFPLLAATRDIPRRESSFHGF